MGNKQDITGAVIEIEEVEYLIKAETAKQINKESDLIILHRLIDNENIVFPLIEVKKAIERGIIDRL